MPDTTDRPADPHWEYFNRSTSFPHSKDFTKEQQKLFLLSRCFPSGAEDGPEDLAAVALMLGVAEVTREQLKAFRSSLEGVRPRLVEGFGFGKIHAHLAKKME